MRNQALDVLRGVAILMVLSCHCFYFRLAHQAGWMGVDLFFVLSGFLISGLLFDEYNRSGRIDLKRFWIRRGFKIYPPYYLLLALLSIYSIMTRGRFPQHILSGAIFLQNYLGYPLPIWGHTWSLDVEEHFYFALPLLLLALVKRSEGLRTLPRIGVWFALGCLALRVLEWCLRAGPSWIYYAETHLRIDALFFGVMVQYWRTYHPESWATWSKRPLWLGTVLALPAFVFPQNGNFICTVGLSLPYLAFGLLLAWSVERPQSAGYMARACAWIGRRSYSIYLWHLPLWWILFGRDLYATKVTLPVFVAAMASALLFGAILSDIIEKPSLAVRDRLFPSMAGNRAHRISGGTGGNVRDAINTLEEGAAI